MLESNMEIMMSHKLIEKIATLVLHINKEVVRGYTCQCGKNNHVEIYIVSKRHINKCDKC